MTWDGRERRRNLMPNGFQPKDAFEGYVVGKLKPDLGKSYNNSYTVIAIYA